MDKIKVRRDRENASEGGTPTTPVAGVSSDEDVPMSYFENTVGGKRVVENGVTKIII